MKNSLVFLVIFILLFFVKTSFADINVLGFQYNDSIASNNLILFEAVLNQSDFLKENKNISEGIPIIRPQESRTIYFFISILLLYIIAMVKTTFSFQFNNSYNLLDLFNKNNKRINNETLSLPVIYYYTLYFSTLGFLIYKYLYLKKSYIFLEHHAFNIFFISVLTIATLIIVKTGLSYLSSWVFNVKDKFINYFQHQTLINKYTSIALVVLSFIILWMGNMVTIKIINIAFVLLLFSILLKVVYNFKISLFLIKNYFFYFILYLCTLEVIPVLILIKWIKNIS